MKQSVDCLNLLQAEVGGDQTLTLHFDPDQATRLLAAAGRASNGFALNVRRSR